jgi:hypothetical protein
MFEGVQFEWDSCEKCFKKENVDHVKQYLIMFLR